MTNHSANKLEQIIIITDELSGHDEVGKQLFAVAVVDGQSQEMTLLNEIRFRTIGADVYFVENVVVLPFNAHIN